MDAASSKRDGQISAERLERSLGGAIIIRKGHHDVISASLIDSDFQSSAKVQRKMLCKEEGGLKRSGGLGDILAGAVATFLAWNSLLTRETPGERDVDDVLLACWSACCVVKRATKVAFDKKKRAMTAPDVLEEIGETVDVMTSKL